MRTIACGDNGTQAAVLQLRPYQQDALRAIHEAEEARGIRRPLVSWPTGAGKTVLFAHLIRQRCGRALVLAHRDELIRQAAGKIRMVLPEANVGVVKAEEDDDDAAVVVASVQTLSRPRRLARLAPTFATIVVDEAHHSTADSYRRVLAHVGAFDAEGPLVLGVTATAERADGGALSEIWQEVVHERSIFEMVQEGYLADLWAIQVHLDVDFHHLHSRHGDFLESEAASLLQTAGAPQYAAQAYHEHADGRKALLFTASVDLAHAMARIFRQEGIAAEALDGTTPVHERLSILRRFHIGQTRVLCNCGVLIEGFDEPSIDCVIMARPTKSRALYVQCIGRGTRVYPNKNDCLILDFVGATTRYDLVTAATLFDVPPEVIAHQTLRHAFAARTEAREPNAMPVVSAGLVANVVDLFRRRPLHWVQAGTAGFILTLGERGWLTLEPEGERWSVIRFVPDGQRTSLATGLSLAYAQGVAEDCARQMGAGGLVNPRGGWRQAPASHGQIRLMRYLRVPVREGLTKGQAADLITIARASRAMRPRQGVAHG